MITIIDKNKQISVTLKGSIKRIPTLRGQITTETALGVEKTESSRGVINLVLDITYMSITDYNNLELLFLTSSTFDIINSDKGSHYINYYIAGTTLDLEDVEDLRDNTYYYVGSLSLNRR